jgi:hypothetical protein
MWIFILVSTGSNLMAGGLVIIFVGAIVYFIKAKVRKEWPFAGNENLYSANKKQ